jgi:hypothetical protein
VEGLRLDEALHPLTLLTVGVYGKALPPQNKKPYSSGAARFQVVGGRSRVSSMLTMDLMPLKPYFHGTVRRTSITPAGHRLASGLSVPAACSM